MNSEVYSIKVKSRPHLTKLWNEDPSVILTPRHQHQAVGRAYCLNYDFQTHEYTEFDYPYYLSKAGMLCFHASPALFNGMSPERIGQYEDHGRYSHMVTNAYFYEEHKCLFLKNVVRRYRSLFAKPETRPPHHPALAEWLR